MLNVGLRLKIVKDLALTLHQHAFFRTTSVFMTQRDLRTRESTHFEVRSDQFPIDLILSLQILEKIMLMLTLMTRNRRGGNCQRNVLAALLGMISHPGLTIRIIHVYHLNVKETCVAILVH